MCADFKALAFRLSIEHRWKAETIVAFGSYTVAERCPVEETPGSVIVGIPERFRVAKAQASSGLVLGGQERDLGLPVGGLLQDEPGVRGVSDGRFQNGARFESIRHGKPESVGQLRGVEAATVRF